MRKRLGAIHSDSTEEYEKLAIETNNKSLIFYNSKNHSSKKINEKILSSFDYCYDYVVIKKNYNFLGILNGYM